MRQRLGIAAALLGDPPIIMLDEPFNGMDPEGIVWMRGFLRSLAAQGRAVLVSSHLMSELQDTADHLVVVGRGMVIADTSVTSLLETASRNQVVVRTPEPEGATTVLVRAGAIVTSGPGAITVTGLTPDRIVTLLNAGVVPFSEVVRAPRDAGGGLPRAHPRRRRVPRRGAAMTAGFFQLLHAEWTKFRTVRGWVIGMAAAALMMVLVALLAGISSDQKGAPAVPVGPSGEPVTDSFYFVHQPLTGDGSITVSVTALDQQRPRRSRRAAARCRPVGEGRADHQEEHRPRLALRRDHG